MKHLKLFEKFEKKVLIIENDDYPNSGFIKTISEITKTTPKILGGLKMRSNIEGGMNQIMSGLNESDVIAMETTAVDTDQINKFMTIFSKLEDKTVLIKTDKKGQEKIKSNPLYNINLSKHKIIFI